MKVFIAGHKGLVGSALVRRFADTHEINTATKQQVDLCNQQQTYDFLEQSKPDLVVVAAA